MHLTSRHDFSEKKGSAFQGLFNTIYFAFFVSQLLAQCMAGFWSTTAAAARISKIFWSAWLSFVRWMQCVVSTFLRQPWANNFDKLKAAILRVIFLEGTPWVRLTLALKQMRMFSEISRHHIWHAAGVKLELQTIWTSHHALRFSMSACNSLRMICDYWWSYA